MTSNRNRVWCPNPDHRTRCDFSGTALNWHFLLNFFNLRSYSPFKSAIAFKWFPCSELASGAVKRHLVISQIKPRFVEHKRICICLSIFCGENDIMESHKFCISGQFNAYFEAIFVEILSMAFAASGRSKTIWHHFVKLLFVWYGFISF
jgi:hypothetical protein